MSQCATCTRGGWVGEPRTCARRTGVNAPFARPRPRRTQTGALVTSTPSFHVHRTHRSDANGGDTHPRRHADQTWMVVIGREESAGMSSVEGVVPAATK